MVSLSYKCKSQYSQKRGDAFVPRNYGVLYACSRRILDVVNQTESTVKEHLTLVLPSPQQRACSKDCRPIRREKHAESPPKWGGQPALFLFSFFFSFFCPLQLTFRSLNVQTIRRPLVLYLLRLGPWVCNQSYVMVMGLLLLPEAIKPRTPTPGLRPLSYTLARRAFLARSPHALAASHNNKPLPILSPLPPSSNLHLLSTCILSSPFYLRCCRKPPATLSALFTSSYTLHRTLYPLTS